MKKLSVYIITSLLLTANLKASECAISKEEIEKTKSVLTYYKNNLNNPIYEEATDLLPNAFVYAVIGNYFYAKKNRPADKVVAPWQVTKLLDKMMIGVAIANTANLGFNLNDIHKSYEANLDIKTTKNILEEITKDLNDLSAANICVSENELQQIKIVTLMDSIEQNMQSNSKLIDIIEQKQKQINHSPELLSNETLLQNNNIATLLAASSFAIRKIKPSVRANNFYDMAVLYLIATTINEALYSEVSTTQSDAATLKQKATELKESTQTAKTLLLSLKTQLEILNKYN